MDMKCMRSILHSIKIMGWVFYILCFTMTNGSISIINGCTTASFLSETELRLKLIPHKDILTGFKVKISVGNQPI